MNRTKALESIYFINIPENFKFSETALKIDTKIPLPVQRKEKDDPGNFQMDQLSPEQILAGILTILAYDSKNEHLDYYRAIINQARPNIRKELTEAAILKAKNEDWDLAEELFLTLRGLDPKDNVTVLNYALFLDQRAESYRRSGLHEDADAYDNDALYYYKEAMNSEPPLPDAFFNAGFYFLKQHDFSEAKNSFETYLALTCDTPDNELGENGIYKKERAQEIINNISNDNMDDEAFHNAYKLISSGQEEKGLDEIRRFLTSHPKVWNAWFLTGWGMRRLGKWEQAEQAFREGMKYGGENSSDLYNELAICLMEQNKTEEAKQMLMKALSIAPEDTKIISNLGFLAEKQGNKAEAQKYFTAVLEFDPNDKIAAAELYKLEKAE